MSLTNEEYLKLITSQWATKQKFVEYVKTFLDLIDPINVLHKETSRLFGIDTASGDQLDIIGKMIGIPRQLPLDDPDIPSVLTDELYRKVIKSRVYSNHWDGSREQLEYIIETIFPGLPYILSDYQDMSYSITIISPEISEVEKALLFNGYILPKPSGVAVNYLLSEGALFSWDKDSDMFKGWDEGIWSQK